MVSNWWDVFRLCVNFEWIAGVFSRKTFVFLFIVIYV